jgi:hypothetical protein
MNGDAAVYDLGEVDVEEKPRRQTASTRAIRQPISRHEPAMEWMADPTRDQSRRAWLVGVALFVPGGSHMLRGEAVKGLAFLGAIGFCGALAWAILGTLDRLFATFSALGLPPQSGLWVLLVLYVVTAMVHVASVYGAAPRRTAAEPVSTPHPMVAGVASLIVPGWGQAAKGHRKSAVLFLTGCWLAAGAWILFSPAVQDLLGQYGLHLPQGLQVLTSSTVRWTCPLLLWVLAVYDAAMRAGS